MRALITGAQGFVGRYVVAHWLDQDPAIELIGLGRSKRNAETFTHLVSRGSERIMAPLPKPLAEAARSARYSYICADLLERSTLTAILREVAADVIVHLASGLRDDASEYLFKTNVLGTESLYHAAAAAYSGALPPILIASSGSIYGSVRDEHLPITESLPPAPFDMYSISKAAQESTALMLGRRFNIKTTIGRIFAIVGSGQDERHICGMLAAQIASIEAGLKAPEIALSPLLTTRDFVDVRDAAAALVHIAARPHEDQIYNIGSGHETPVRLVFCELIELARFATPPAIKLGPPRATDMPRNVADISRLKSLGFAPRFGLRQSLSGLLDYYRDLIQAKPPR